MAKWYQPRKPNEITPLPWLAPEAISYLENLIQPDWEILEHGSGGSTLWFAARCKQVTAIENNQDWYEIVKRQAPPNVSVILDDASYKFPSNADLLLIDGEPVVQRKIWITIAPRGIVKPGGWIVLDNANRPEYATEREGLRQYAELVHTVDSNKAAGFMYLVTEFWRVK